MKLSSNHSANEQPNTMPGREPAARLAAAASEAPGEFQRFVADVEDLIEATTSLTGEDLSRAKASLSARVSAAKASLADMGSMVTSQARQAAKATDGYVHENPWQSIGIGAAVGLVVGFLIARRN